jgi:hypothetical protein
MVQALHPNFSTSNNGQPRLRDPMQMASFKVEKVPELPDPYMYQYSIGFFLKKNPLPTKDHAIALPFVLYLHLILLMNVNGWKKLF